MRIVFLVLTGVASCAFTMLAAAAVLGPPARADVVEPAKPLVPVEWADWTRARICAPEGELACTPAALAPGSELEAEIACLAELLYWEARGEPLKGRMAVVDVVLLRVERAWRGQTTICGVARDRSLRRGEWKWQFVGMQREGQAKSEPHAWREAQRVARFAMSIHWQQTIDADHFYAGCDDVRPWVDESKMRPVDCIGAHYFWRHE